MTWQDRFWAKVDRRGSDDCWEWTASTNASGYGQLMIVTPDGPRPHLAHRLSWELHADQPIPEGLCALHRCDNPPCVNPGHLFIGTRGDNNRDMHAKKRDNNWNRAKTECKQGHPLSGDNLVPLPSGERRCRECDRAASRRAYRRRKVSAATAGGGA